MPFVLHQFALVRDGYVVAFTDDRNAPLKQEPKPKPEGDPDRESRREMLLELGFELEPEPELELEPEPVIELVLLPVVADLDPPLAADERLRGPEYEVLEDRVRAYGVVVKADPSEIPKLTFAQLLIGLVTEGWIVEADGDGWLAGTLPAPVLAVIGTLPKPMQFPAKARAIRPSEVLLSDPLVQMLGAAQGKTPDDLAAFFATYSQA